MSQQRSLEELRNAVDTSVQQPYISIKGGDFFAVDKLMEQKIDVGDYDKETKTKFLDVVIVDINPNDSHLYYEGEFDESQPSSPTCYSDNGIAPSRNAEQPQAPFCRSCQWNNWGTGKGRGKACKDIKKLAVLIPAYGLDKAWLLRVPPTSLSNLRSFTRALQAVKVEGQGALAIDVLTRVAFAKDKLFTLNFNYVRTLHDSPEDAALYEAAKAMFESGDTADIVGLNDEPIRQQELLPAPATQAAAPRQVEHQQAVKMHQDQRAATRMQEEVTVDYEQVNDGLANLPPRRGRR